MSGVALDHHGSRFEDSAGDLGDGELLVVGFLGGDDWGIRTQHKVDSWVWDQVGLELGDVDVQSTVEPQRGSQ